VAENIFYGSTHASTPLFYAHFLFNPTMPTQKMTSDTECAEYDDLERAKYGKVSSALKSSFAPNILAALLAKGSGWTPAVMRSYHLRFISISPSFSVRICCRACGKTQAYGSFEGHAKNCKAEMWRLTSRLSEQERAEGKAADDDDVDNDTKEDTKKKRPGKKGTDNKNQWLDMFANHRDVFRDGGGKNAIYWANRGDGNFEDGVAYVIHPVSVPKIRGICYVCGWFATLNKMRDHMDTHRDNYYGCEYKVRRLHCGKPIIDHRLSLDGSESDDDSTDAKMPARAPKTAEDQGDGALKTAEDENSDADEEEGKVEEVLTQGEAAMFEAVAKKNQETWDQDIATQTQEGQEQTAGEESTKEKKASKKKQKRKKAVEEDDTAPKTRSQVGNRRSTRIRGN
jgi:hypothetical protein